MAAHRAKSTAQLAAFARAVAFLEIEPQLRVQDDMAVRFLDPPLALATRSRLLRKLAVRLYDRKLPGAYLYTIARTKHIDTVLRRELVGGAREVVILGAGYDSRAYRFHDEFPAARFIEVDHPATSAAKLAKVTALFACPPDQVSYLAADLAGETLAAAPLRAGHDPTQRTLFIAEGLTSAEIAERLSLSRHTVDMHRLRLRKRLGATTSGDVVRIILDGRAAAGLYPKPKEPR